MYWFTVTANNSFGSTDKSNIYPPAGMDGIEGLKIQFNSSRFILCCLNFISVQTTSSTTTDSTNPTSTNAVPVASSTVVPNDAVVLVLVLV